MRRGNTKAILIGGARPNFMKIAPLLKEFRRQKAVVPILVHTGQHYDYEMSDVFLRDLGITQPQYSLRAGSGSHAGQTARIMTAFEKVCLRERPALVIVVGDVNSTLACSITAKKLGIGVAHVEAGLRSFDMSMPEEINRVLVDRLADLLFVSEESGVVNLRKEGVAPRRIFFVGNTMIDSLLHGLKLLDGMGSGGFATRSLKNALGRYGVVTLHRPANVDQKTTLSSLIGALAEISREIPLIFPLHPRTKKNMKRFGIDCPPGVHALHPLGYMEFLSLYRDAALVLTDSGGLQEETTFLGIPCLTLRENTERPVTVTRGTNTIVGCDRQKIIREARRITSGRHKKGSVPKFWDGRSAGRIVRCILRHLN